MVTVSDTLFLAKPQTLYVDQDYSVKPPRYQTIDLLMQSLQEYGPLVTYGKLGPSAYHGASFKLTDRIADNEVYGWKPNTFKEQNQLTSAILLGAQKTEKKSYVYYTLAKDITLNKTSQIRGYQPLDTDTKIYVMSYDNFLNRSLVDLHPICPHGAWLYSVAVNDILDGKDTQKRCKEIGQEIFDHYKNAARNNSDAGMEAVKRICNAARFLSNDGPVRKAHIEYAWDGIGDENWRWQR